MTPHPELAPGLPGHLGATLPGRMVVLREAGAHRSSQSQSGAQSGVSPQAGEAGTGSSRSVAGRVTPRDAQSGWCRRDPGDGGIRAPCGRRLRGGGAATPPAPSTTTRPPAASPLGPRNGPTRPGPGRPPTGTPRAPPGRASPPPRPSPQPDSPREYRDLGDSRSRSALSNEMKSEGIAARPSPARGQREGGSGGGGGTSAPGPRAPNQGRRGEGGCRCLLLEGSDFHPAEDRGNGCGVEGKLHGDYSRRPRRGVQGGEREGGELAGPFRASPQRKLTIAATAAAADRNMSPAPRGHCASA